MIAMATRKSSLRGLLPARLETARLELELLDESAAHYEVLLAAMNSPVTRARLGDMGIRTAAEFAAYTMRNRLRPASLGKRADEIHVDASIYYLPRLKSEECAEAGMKGLLHHLTATPQRDIPRLVLTDRLWSKRRSWVLSLLYSVAH